MSNKLPKCVLVRCELIGTVSERALLLYSLLCDLMHLSEQNKAFHDDSGTPFVLYPVERVADVFHIGQTQARATFRELESAGLIVRVKQGLGKPSRIYIPKTETDEKPTVKTDEKPTVKTDEKPTVKTDEKPTVKTDEKPTASHHKESIKVSQRKKSSSSDDSHENLPNQMSFDDFFVEMMTKESTVAEIIARMVVENPFEFADITPEIADFVAKNVENALKSAKITNISGYVRAALRNGFKDFELSRSRHLAEPSDNRPDGVTYDLAAYDHYDMFDNFFDFDAPLPPELQTYSDKLVLGRRLYVKDLSPDDVEKVKTVTGCSPHCQADID